ncbi:MULTISPECIES: ABC transporter ATP-binding protein [Actinomadura]|uniref:Amino acid/amide ABC transporter ATP-binding protein 2, HAAT family n=1 Tax=Actinomadura madurae TaxID=1993 RepID=A0A1I5TVA3_9ACTN|nr:ABC transporter ATP-binding protein [Actinomadura madurae]SFP87012.1 amino acid/amide ABC transporter ATP-binding protein 2, HAAT family [Actinomadura madurae]SPT51584.1 LIV-I protein F [Actinomadura madurae]
MLTVESLEVTYGSVRAVAKLDIALGKGRATALLGANGAGKSSTMRAIGGLLRPSGGRVVFDGEDITGMPAHKVARRGLALVPEGRMVVGCLTVQENLALSAYARGRRRTALADDVYDLFPRLAERRGQTAALMSGGEQQMLAIGRALMTAPSLLLLDEPSMGLSPALVETVFSAISQIRSAGMTMLLVEQNAALAFPMADHACLIQRGAIVAEGTPAELEKDPATIARHLGIDEEPGREPASKGAAS